MNKLKPSAWAGLLLIPIILLVIFWLFHERSQIQKNLSDYQSVWNVKRISNYQLRVVTTSLPVLPVALDLKIRNGVIVDSSIVPCDNPSEEFPQTDCEVIAKYYSQVGRYTVDQLFGNAEYCLNQTKISLATCPVFIKNEIHNFSSTHEMFEIADSCKSYLSSMATLCYVEYDSIYGYPKYIAGFMPAAVDGFSSTQITDFQIIQ